MVVLRTQWGMSDAGHRRQMLDMPLVNMRPPVGAHIGTYHSTARADHSWAERPHRVLSDSQSAFRAALWWHRPEAQ
jgi:hypothetical protein